MKVSTLDIAWAAGIYEGEGSFDGRQVVIVQKDTYILYKLIDIFGFGSVRPHPHKTYKYRVCGRDARGFLLSIFKFLSPRRKLKILNHKNFFVKR